MLCPCKSPCLTLLTAIVSITSTLGTLSDPNHVSYGDNAVGELEQLHKTANLGYSQTVKLRELPISIELSDFHDIDSTAWPRIGKGLSRKLMHNKYPYLKNLLRSNDETVSLNTDKRLENHISQTQTFERISPDTKEHFSDLVPSPKTSSPTLNGIVVTSKTLPPFKNSDNTGVPSRSQPLERNNHFNTNVQKRSVDASPDSINYRFARSTQSEEHEMRNRAPELNFDSDKANVLPPGSGQSSRYGLDNFFDDLGNQGQVIDNEMAQLLQKMPEDVILLAPLEIQYDTNDIDDYDDVGDVSGPQVKDKNLLRQLEQMVASSNYHQISGNSEGDLSDTHDMDKRDRSRIMSILRQRAKNTHREPIRPQPRRNRLHQIEKEIIQRKQNRRPLERLPSDQPSTCAPERDGTNPMTCPSADNVCLYDEMICDGTRDCPGGEDETFALCVLRHWTFRWLSHFRTMFLPLSKSAKKSS